MESVNEAILKYAADMGIPAVGIVVVAVLSGLTMNRFLPRPEPKADPIDAINRDIRELSDAVLQLRMAVSSVSSLPAEMGRLSSEVVKLASTVTDLRVTVARIEGRIEE